MPNDSVFASSIQTLETDQERALCFCIELELQVVQSLAELLGLLECRFFVFMFVREPRVEVFEPDVGSRCDSKLLAITQGLDSRLLMLFDVIHFRQEKGCTANPRATRMLRLGARDPRQVST